MSIDIEKPSHVISRIGNKEIKKSSILNFTFSVMCDLF